MKRIGLIGVMTWLSTWDYYRIINTLVSNRLGDNHSARIVLYSYDFNSIFGKQFEGDWRGLSVIIRKTAESLLKVGADFIVLSSVTIHKALDFIPEKRGLPILDIRDAVGKKIVANNIEKVGLVGTSITMTDGFFTNYLLEKYDIKTIIPEENEIRAIDDIIFKEIANGIIKDESKYTLDKIIKNLLKKGAEGIILGCTELHMLTEENKAVGFYDSMKIHAESAAIKAMDDRNG